MKKIDAVLSPIVSQLNTGSILAVTYFHVYNKKKPDSNKTESGFGGG